LDRALQQLSRAQEAILSPDSNQKMLTDTDSASAIKLGGEDKHLVAMYGRPRSLGAATDMPDTPLSVEPASPPGRSAGAAGGLLDQLNGFCQGTFKYLLDPDGDRLEPGHGHRQDAISIGPARALGSCAYRSGLGERLSQNSAAHVERGDEESVALAARESPPDNPWLTTARAGRTGTGGITARAGTVRLAAGP